MKMSNVHLYVLITVSEMKHSYDSCHGDETRDTSAVGGKKGTNDAGRGSELLTISQLEEGTQKKKPREGF